MRIPMLSMIGGRSPMDGLLEHYGQIEAAMSLIQESLLCYMEGRSTCKDFMTLKGELDNHEENADVIKRNIRNHLPHSLFMAVDKTLFINYTRAQDNILDAAQDALDWLNIHDVNLAELIGATGLALVEEATRTVELLKPALEDTIKLVHTDIMDRQLVKTKYRAVREQHKKVRRLKSLIFSELYKQDLDFKSIFQLLHFFDRMNEMSHNAENCVDMLRAMIAR
jgi:predicted phosphate transport protein (TIGR00153 family)